MENTVDAECPDEPCMKEHPEWKHFEEANVADAFDATMEEMGLMSQANGPNQSPAPMGPMPQPVMMQARPPPQFQQMAPRPMPMQP